MSLPSSWVQLLCGLTRTFPVWRSPVLVLSGARLGCCSPRTHWRWWTPGWVAWRGVRSKPWRLMETEWESAGKEEEEEERMWTGRYPPSKWRGGVRLSGFSSDGAGKVAPPPPPPNLSSSGCKCASRGWVWGGGGGAERWCCAIR